MFRHFPLTNAVFELLKSDLNQKLNVKSVKNVYIRMNISVILHTENA